MRPGAAATLRHRRRLDGKQDGSSTTTNDQTWHPYGGVGGLNRLGPGDNLVPRSPLALLLLVLWQSLFSTMTFLSLPLHSLQYAEIVVRSMDPDVDFSNLSFSVRPTCPPCQYFDLASHYPPLISLSRSVTAH